MNREMAAVPHICILTTAHPKDDVRVDNKIGKSFLAAGFRVTWIGPDHAFFDASPDARYVHMLFRPGKGRFGRLVNIFQAYWRARRIPRIDVYYAPDPDAASLAVRLAKAHGAKVIFDIHEVFHKAMLERWLGGRGARLFGQFIRNRILHVCRACDLVIGVSHAVLDPYGNSPGEKCVVRSCAPQEFAHESQADVCGPSRSRFTIMHGKNLPARGTDVVLDALRIVKDRVADLQIVMFETLEPGTPADREFHRRVEEAGLADYLDLRHSVPNSEMPAVLRDCDAGLIVYGRAFGEDSLPNRLFEYMAAGLPVIAPVYSHEIVSILEAEKCGISVDVEDPGVLAEAIIFLQTNPERAREMGRRARESFVLRHNWEVEVEPLLCQIRNWLKGHVLRDAS